MAQLRDAKTSELVGEGTPLELILIVDELGKRAHVPQPGEEVPDDVELLYDDVGLSFDPDAVLAHERERRDNLETVAGDPDAADHHRETAAANIAEHDAAVEAAKGRAADVDRAVGEARERAGG